MKINFIYIFITLSPILFSSCAGDVNIRQIKMDESLMIIDDMNKYSFDKVFMDSNNYLIINDTLLLPDTVGVDSVKTIWTAHRLSLKDYAKDRNIQSIALDKFKNLMIISNNKRIIKEQNSYFFNEGGWIDSDFGKVFSKSKIEDKEKDFKFDRVQEIKAILDKPNWYEYYAD